MKIVLMIIQSQRAQKRNQKVCTRLLFNFWDRININQVDSLQHYASNQHIIVCAAENSASLMFYQPARKVKRVQRKTWILIITKNQFHNGLLTCLFMISNNFWVRTERNCCQRGSNFTHSVLTQMLWSVRGLTKIWVKMNSCKCTRRDIHFSINLET